VVCVARFTPFLSEGNQTIFIRQQLCQQIQLLPRCCNEACLSHRLSTDAEVRSRSLNTIRHPTSHDATGNLSIPHDASVLTPRSKERARPCSIHIRQPILWTITTIRLTCARVTTICGRGRDSTAVLYWSVLRDARLPGETPSLGNFCVR
jgi:hypothetical protein